MTHTPADSAADLRGRIDAHCARLLELCFDANTGELRDRPLAERLARLIEILARMNRDQLVGLQILPDPFAFGDLAAAPFVPRHPLRRESDELVILRSLADASGHGFFVADLQGNIAIANPAAAKLLRLSGPSALEGRNIRDYYPEGTVETRGHENIAKVIETGSWVGEVDMLSARGERIPTQHRLFILHGEMGREPYIGGLIIDGRPQKQTLEALRASEENFRTLVESAPDGILIALGEGEHVYANARAAEITGYTVRELCRMNLRELAHAEELGRLTRIFNRRIETGEGPRSYPTRIRHRDDREIHVEVTGARTLWHGQPADTVMLRDITRRREIERALRESEERYATVVERGYGGVAIVQDDRIVFANRPLGQLLDHEPEALVGLHFLDLVMPEQRDSVEEAYRRTLAGDRQAGYALVTLRRRDGSEVSLETYATVVQYRGRPALIADVRHRMPPPDQPPGREGAGPLGPGD